MEKSAGVNFWKDLKLPSQRACEKMDLLTNGRKSPLDMI